MEGYTYKNYLVVSIFSTELAANEKARVYILASMTDVLAKKHESLAMAKEIIDALKAMFGQTEWFLRHEAIKYIYTKRMKEGTFVREHVLDMMMHINIVEVNGGAIDEANQVSFILESLPKSFIPFQTNASLNKIEFNMTILLNELQRFQTLTIGKEKQVEANVATTKGKFSRGSSSKNKTGPSKPKLQIKKKGKGKTPKQNKGKKAAEKGKCYHCGQNGHWVRNCPKYLVEKKAEKETQGKMTKSSFTGKGLRAKIPIELVHSVLCGPMNVKARGGTPRQNGVSERRNRTLLDMVRSMMSFAQLPDSFWGYALETTVYILITFPLKVFQKHLMSYGKGVKKVYVTLEFEDVRHTCWYKTLKNWNISSKVHTCWYKVFVSTNDSFLEEDHIRDHQPCSKLVLNEISKSASDKPSSSTKVVDKSKISDQTHPSQELREPRRSGRVVHQPNRYLGLSETHVVIPDDGIEDSLTYKQAMNDVDRDQWIKAMNLKIESMFFNSVWTLVDQPNNMNVKIAFLNGNLEESIYMAQPEGYKMQNSKKGVLPCRYGIHLSKEQCPMRKTPYASAVGSLMYAMLCTRPDIFFLVRMVSRYQSNPGRDHWIAVKNILKYLRRTKDYMLIYGLVFTLNGGAVVWRSIKHSCIADSTMEAEYVAACKAAKEAIWLRKFLIDLEIVPNRHLPITLYCDNSGAVANSREPRSHKWGKHIERKYHLIREIVHRGDVVVTQISFEQNIADPFTKALTAKVFESHLQSLGLRCL
ncbi:gag/pol protein [Cucumis melo var. makuwa]|uniref:Gag/pol protein n=1 Tax=Cucumis melo var. makuwa TaxID=1194695 RepID=A0A5D3DK93_CUCMM|nr:gag/pol protein [Cucumis melo var. makuwa]TYK24004.1 gag/pol protein [Cucumis melo var. makuwa]